MELYQAHPTFDTRQFSEIIVKNDLPGNESATIHWHGQNQNKTTYADGNPDLSQCLTPHRGTNQNLIVNTFMPSNAG